MKKDRPIRLNFSISADDINFQIPERKTVPPRQTASTRAPGYSRDEGEPTEQDLQALSKRTGAFPDIPPDVA